MWLFGTGFPYAEPMASITMLTYSDLSDTDKQLVGARNLAECMLIQAMACGQDDDLVVKMIRSHLGNLEKKNYQAIARDPGFALTNYLGAHVDGVTIGTSTSAAKVGQLV